MWPNTKQQDLIDRTDGVFVVDAGAGTGKTAAITRRYQSLLEKTSPDKILLLTFTNNAAENMRGRIINACTGTHSPKELVEAPIATFHSFAHRLLSMHGFNAPACLGIPETLPPGFRVMESDVFEKHLFRRFFHDFQARHAEHAEVFQALGPNTDNLFGLIRQLCCKGIFPCKDGWCVNGQDLLAGDRDGFMEHFEKVNRPVPGSRGPKASPCLSSFRDKLNRKTYQTDLDASENRISPAGGTEMPLFTPAQVNPALAGPAWDENRDALFDCIHDVYFEYIQFSLRSGRINFDLLLMFTFVLLYHNHGLRRAAAFDYVMVDEFQDTNEIQFQLVLLLMGKPNLCVVGDWKQGIYGFRHASITNILEFDEHLEHYRTVLNQDHKRIPFQLKAEHKEFDINYRSSQTILDFSEKALLAPGTRTEQVDPAIRSHITALKADHSLDDATAIRFLRTEDNEYDLILDSIGALLNDPACRVKTREDDGSYSERPMKLRDIAVFTRTRQFGLELQERALERGIPVNYDGGIELFRTRPALLLLAWLRVILNPHQRKGWITILEEAGHTHADMLTFLEKREYPGDLQTFRDLLFAEKRHLAYLTGHILKFYDLDSTIANALQSNLSGLFQSSLISLADLVLFIEANIANHETYAIDLNTSENAVTVQTIHGAKGLEYPVVIMANMNGGRFPGGGHHNTDLFYHPLTGLRISREYGQKNGYAYVFNTWQSDLLTSRLFTDYDEERRLLYVAVTRAQQYLLFTCHKPSVFFDGLRGTDFPLETGLPASASPLPGAAKPGPTTITIKDYDPAPASLAVHDLMEYQAPGKASAGRGREFGNRVHHFAHRLALELKPDWNAPEADRMQSMIDKLRQEGARLLPELECSLPLQGYLIRGIIDLVAEFDDRVVIIDYKSDGSDANAGEYRKQLSVYYHAAAGHYPGKSIEAQVFYVSRDRLETIKPLSLKDLGKLAAKTTEAPPGPMAIAPDELLFD